MHLLVLVVVLWLQLHDLPASWGPVSKPASHRRGCLELSRGVTCPLMRVPPPPRGPRNNNSVLDSETTGCKQTPSLTQIAFRGGGPSSGPRREAWLRCYGTATRVWSWAWPKGPTRTPLAWSRVQTYFCFKVMCTYVFSSLTDRQPLQTTNNNGRGFLEAGRTPELGRGCSK